MDIREAWETIRAAVELAAHKHHHDYGHDLSPHDFDIYELSPVLDYITRVVDAEATGLTAGIVRDVDESFTRAGE